NHISTKLKLIFHLKRSTLVDDIFKQPGKISFVKPVSLTNGAVLKVVTQNMREAALYHHQDLMYSQTKAPWSPIDLSSAGSI
ncbi:unnamed protein product, partial [Hymenolepis diminuta]